MIPVYIWPSPEAVDRIRHRVFADAGLWSGVEKIVREVKEHGDKALLAYTASWDGCVLQSIDLRVTKEEIDKAYKHIDPAFLAALRHAKKNIYDFHQMQKAKDWFVQDATGSLAGQIYRPLKRVGVYVPGGTANYPSSVLMTCLPAVVAGVEEIAMVTPPGEDGALPAATLVAAAEAGVQEIYRVGGAQAIAALAYGTESIRAVDKIVGPGNIYVTLAKKMVYGTVGIDMLAGPSEIMIIGDGSVHPAYAAADLLSQAEHDSMARAILVTTDIQWAGRVKTELEEQLQELPRCSIAQQALEQCGAVIIVQDLKEAFHVANLVAPEHLELLLPDPWSYLSLIQNAGAVFLGAYSPGSVGDYWAGPNHVLPTGGAARYASPLTVDDFCKRSSIINFTRQGLTAAGESICYLAEMEKLAGHGAAIRRRLWKEDKR